ncbi:MAG: hypothetical protein BWY74_01761 [Firmicutes bacterium ADurb.Bin419]|nr:MAG: hypothetical protein BWY74_01761 [Firmicutes bacterium ADurb.Bin419]
MTFLGSIFAIIFGVFWTIMAFSITSGSPFGIIGTIFPLFGIIFVIMGVIQAVYNFQNATGKDRYSIYDITDSQEEGDPIDSWIKGRNDEDEEIGSTQQSIESGANYCPYCGAQLKNEYSFCPICGKQIN